MIRILDPTGKRRRLALFGTIFSTMMLLALILVPSASAVLPNSPGNFEGGNDPTLGLGNMVVDGANGFTDWVSVTGSSAYFHTRDAAAVTTDDSFAPGQKQDSICPTIAGHKNPPKDDFTDIASFTEGGGALPTFLYGATIRYAANGNASENIELNQGTSGECAPGFLARTPGDKLIAIDYLGGGSAVQFHVLTWVATGACFVANDPNPCWGAKVLTLDETIAQGGVNDVAISAENNPISDPAKALVAGQFAEFGVNLFLAGIITPPSCTTFNQTVFESRSSGSSFVSSTKDITIDRHPINSCGSVDVTKTGSDGGSQTGAVFTLWTGSDITDATAIVGTCTIGAVAPAVDCSDGWSGLFAGQYTIDETTLPANYGKAPGLPYTFTLAAGDSLHLTYEDVALTGAIKVTKTSSKGLHPGLAGATFSVTGPGSFSTTLTTDANGVACVDKLVYGSYSVTETAAPTGYAIDDATAHPVTVGSNSTCATTGVAFAATDTPLTNVVVTARGQASPAETTASHITCVDQATIPNVVGESDPGYTDPATATANDLVPGTYICTVVIDP